MPTLHSILLLSKKRRFLKPDIPYIYIMTISKTIKTLGLCFSLFMGITLISCDSSETKHEHEHEHDGEHDEHSENEDLEDLHDLNGLIPGK